MSVSMKCTPHVHVQIILDSVKVAECPPFGKELLTRLTVCTHCIAVLLIMVSEPRYEKTVFFAYAKTKTQISFAVTAKLISAFVFTTRIEQSLYFLYTKFQTSSHLVWLYSPVCVGPGRKPRRPVFSQRGSSMTWVWL